MKKASQHWSELDNARRSLLSRWETLAGYTVPRVCLPGNANDKTADIRHDWQAFGAQAVNHVVNKLMLTLFAPSRPFMRLELSAQARQEFGNIPEDALDDILAEAERKAIKELDSRQDIRPKLYQTLQNLVVTGNACLHFPKESKGQFRSFYSRNWTVQRTATGQVYRLVIRERYRFAEFEPDVQAAYLAHRPTVKAEEELSHYTVCLLNVKGGYDTWQAVEDIDLGEDFRGKYKDYASLPFKVISWSLADNADYGAGLVEDYMGDFAALSALSEAQVKGAILSSEFRWLVNPAGMTSVEDLADSENGAALPGVAGDIAPLTPGHSANLQVVQAVAQEYTQRIARGFLLTSGVTREAERVTAEEIRMQAAELETSLGGAYSRIAAELQHPIATWLLKVIDIHVDGKSLNISIVTGLDALSRSGDLDSLRAALTDIANLNALGPELLGVLQVQNIFATIFTGHGLSGGKFVKSQEQMAEEQQAAQQAQMQQEAASAGIEAGVNQSLV